MSKSVNGQSWTRVAQAYARPDTARSLMQLIVTLGLFIALWAGTLIAVRYEVWAGLVLTVPAAGLLVRLFMIQHDCGHGAFFRSRRLNTLVGRCLGILTLTPYKQWRRAHAVHHANSGHLGRRGIGDVGVLTLAEYRARSRWRRALYRIYRNPVVLFGLGPVFLFVIKHRFPWRVSFKGRTPVASVAWTNLGIGAAIGTLVALFGGWPVLLTQGPITLMASTIGTWLFYIQHQFENTHWEDAETWRFEDAALRGSSYYDLPAVLEWFTAHIGIHHIHHLCSRIPNYRLRQCLADNPALSEQANRLTFRQSLHCAKLALWDETNRRLVSFRHAQQEAPA